MSNIFFPEAFKTALGETSFAVLFFDAAFDDSSVSKHGHQEQNL